MRNLLKSTLPITLLSSLFLIPAFAQQTADEKTKEQVMFVLDGSNSMWGQIKGTAKISIAKEVMTDLVQGWDRNIPMGLTVYGHRRKNDCSDIEVVSLPGTADRNQITEKVQQISPRGKTPLTDSVRLAAASIGGFTGAKSSVILVSDGLETCGGDPCALARTLKSINANFTTHVIGFDVTKEEFQSLQCMATETGGKFFRANNASELKDALQQTAQAITASKAEPTSAPKTKPAVKAEPVAASFLYAKLCETCKRLAPIDVIWDVQKNGVKFFQGLGILYQTDPEMVEGNYTVSARYLGSSFSTKAEIKVGADGKQIGEVNLNLGGITLSAFASDDETLAADRVVYRFYPIIDGAVSEEDVEVATQGGSVTWLPDGEYQITAIHQKLSETTQVKIVAGEITDYTFDLRFGYFQPFANLVAGGKLIGKFTYRVFATKEAAEKGDSGIAFGTSIVRTKLALKAGGYWVETIYSPSNVSQVRRILPITITANILSTPILSLDAGIVNFNVTGGSEEAFTFLLWLRKVNADGSDGPVVGKTSHREDSAALEPGRYRLFEFYSKLQTDDFEIIAGQTITFTPILR